MSRILWLVAAILALGQAANARSQSLTDAQRDEYRKKAEALREKNARERDEIQKGFRPPNEAASKPPTKSTAPTFNPKDPCGIDGFEQRLELFARAYPGLQQPLQRVLSTSEFYVGMPELMLRVLTCGAIKNANSTTTASGVARQYVLSDRSGFFAKFVYVRDGAVYAIQD